MLPKVLETHTVSGVTTKEYSVFSALEGESLLHLNSFVGPVLMTMLTGTWTVTFISDRYCRYPPSPQDGTMERFKH